jgi:hypothetical protein
VTCGLCDRRGAGLRPGKRALARRRASIHPARLGPGLPAALLTFGVGLALRGWRIPRPLTGLGTISYSVYHPGNGGEPLRCPLISAITTSNELPGGADSAAVYDRLLARIEAGYLEDPS